MGGPVPGFTGVGGGLGGPGGAPGVQKPNPYVIAETKERGADNLEVTYKYPRSKIFVGGLDFKLTVEELREHFL